MDEIDLLFQILRKSDGGLVENGDLEKVVPVIEKICSDFSKRELFLRKFRELNDKDFQYKIADSFNFAISKIEEFKNGLITESELVKTLLGSGGVTAIISGSLAAISGVSVAVVAFAPYVVVLGVLAVIAGLGIYLYQQDKKNRREKMISDIKSLSAMMYKEM